MALITGARSTYYPLDYCRSTQIMFLASSSFIYTLCQFTVISVEVVHIVNIHQVTRASPDSHDSFIFGSNT